MSALWGAGGWGAGPEMKQVLISLNLIFFIRQIGLLRPGGQVARWGAVKMKHDPRQSARGAWDPAKLSSCGFPSPVNAAVVRGNHGTISVR